MATEIFEIGSVSSRGQIAIPTDIRRVLGLEEGTRILFVVENDTILMKKVTADSFANITHPLRQAKKNIKEEEVVDIVHKFRASKK